MVQTVKAESGAETMDKIKAVYENDEIEAPDNLS